MAKTVWAPVGGGKVGRGSARALVLPAVATWLALSAGAGHAQFTTSAPRSSRFATLSVERPVHADDVGFDSFVGHARIGGPLRENVGVVGGISIAHARRGDRPASTVLSNAFVRFLFGGEGGYGALTLTLPTSGRVFNAEAYASDAGLAADIERPELFTPRVTGVSFLLNPRRRFGAYTVGARGGLAVVAPSGFRREFYARYGAFAQRSRGGAGWAWRSRAPPS